MEEPVSGKSIHGRKRRRLRDQRFVASLEESI